MATATPGREGAGLRAALEPDAGDGAASTPNSPSATAHRMDTHAKLKPHTAAASGSKGGPTTSASAGAAAGGGALSGLAVARLSARVAGLEAQLSAARAESAKALAQVEARKQAAMALEDEGARLRQALRTAAASQQEEQSKLKAQVVAAEGARDLAVQQLANAQNELQALAGNRERSAREGRETAAALRASLAAAEAERTDAVARCAQQGMLVDALEAELASLRSQLGAVQSQLSEQSAALAAHAARVSAHLATQEELLDSLEARDVALKRTRQERDAGLACAAELEAAMQQLQRQLEHGKAERAALKDAAQMSQAALQAALQEKRTFAEQLRHSEEALGAVRAALSDNTAALQALTAHAAASDAARTEQLAGLEAQLVHAQEVGLALEVQVQELKGQVEEEQSRAAREETRAGRAEERAKELEAAAQKLTGAAAAAVAVLPAPSRAAAAAVASTGKAADLMVGGDPEGREASWAGICKELVASAPAVVPSAPTEVHPAPAAVPVDIPTSHASMPATAVNSSGERQSKTEAEAAAAQPQPTAQQAPPTAQAPEALKAEPAPALALSMSDISVPPLQRPPTVAQQPAVGQVVTNTASEGTAAADERAAKRARRQSPEPPSAPPSGQATPNTRVPDDVGAPTANNLRPMDTVPALTASVTRTASVAGAALLPAAVPPLMPLTSIGMPGLAPLMGLGTGAPAPVPGTSARAPGAQHIPQPMEGTPHGMAAPAAAGSAQTMAAPGWTWAPNADAAGKGMHPAFKPVAHTTGGALRGLGPLPGQSLAQLLGRRNLSAGRPSSGSSSGVSELGSPNMPLTQRPPGAAAAGAPAAPAAAAAGVGVAGTGDGATAPASGAAVTAAPHSTTVGQHPDVKGNAGAAGGGDGKGASAALGARGSGGTHANVRVMSAAALNNNKNNKNEYSGVGVDATDATPTCLPLDGLVATGQHPRADGTGVSVPGLSGRAAIPGESPEHVEPHGMAAPCGGAQELAAAGFDGPGLEAGGSPVEEPQVDAHVLSASGPAPVGAAQVGLAPVAGRSSPATMAAPIGLQSQLAHRASGSVPVAAAGAVDGAAEGKVTQGQQLRLTKARHSKGKVAQPTGMHSALTGVFAALATVESSSSEEEEGQ